MKSRLINYEHRIKLNTSVYVCVMYLGSSFSLTQVWFKSNKSSLLRVFEKTRNHITIFPKNLRQCTYNKEKDSVDSHDCLSPEGTSHFKN